MLNTILIHKQGNNADFMEKFEIYAQNNSFEISTLLSLSYDRSVPTNIRNKWLQTFNLLAKSMKIRSLKNIINGTEIIQKLFNSCTEYQACSHFIQNNLIPIIVDYEMTNQDLIKEIIDLYQHKIDSHAQSIKLKTSVFNIFGWIELFLFLFLNVSDIFSLSLPLYFTMHQTLTTSIATVLILIFSVHLFVAINSFNKRRIFCYYLQALAPQINCSYKYTPYILEGFNIYDISLFHNTDYNESVKLIYPNQIDTYCILLLSLKYILGIVYCLCTIDFYIGVISIFLLPIILFTLFNLDNIYKKVYKSTYQNIITFYQNSADYEYEQIATEDTESSHNIQTIHNQAGKLRYFCRFNAYLLGYSLLMLCCWPLLLLTPFVFGFSIMCNIDPGLQQKWPMRQFCRYWAAFMAIKVIVGMTIVTVCDLCCNARTRTQSTNETNNDVDDDNENDNKNYDAYNTVCYTAMNVVSIAVVALLVFGRNSIVTQIFRVLVWFVVYIWISACSIKHIIPENQRVINWKSLFKINAWLTSNLLHTEL